MSGMTGTQIAGCEYMGRLPTLQEPALEGAIRCGSTLGGAFYGVVAQGQVRAVVGEPAGALRELLAAPPPD